MESRLCARGGRQAGEVVLRTEVFCVERHGERWAVVSGSQVLALAATDAAAAELAIRAAKILRGFFRTQPSAPMTQAPAEPRSFAPIRE